jgi:probable rRNA maturation factor
MSPCHSTRPAKAGHIDIIIADSGWTKSIRRPAEIARRAAEQAGVSANILLASDRAVQGLNARYRGRNKPTNVLTFEPGDIVLALGTVKREAQAAGRTPAAHLAHLVVHGALHLQGMDHHHAGDARRMEMAETRLLSKLGVANPWKGTKPWA